MILSPVFGVRTRQKIITVHLGDFLREVNVGTGGNCQFIEEEVVIFGLDEQDFCLLMERSRDSDDVFFFLDANLACFVRINPSVLN